MIYILSFNPIQTKNCEKFCRENDLKYRIMPYEDTNLIKNNIKKEKTNVMIIKDFENINLGIINYTKTMIGFLSDNKLNWDAFILLKDFHFWHNQAGVNLPKFNNSWTGFGEHISKFLIKKISSPFDFSDNPIDFQSGICIVNHKNIDKSFEEFNFCRSNMLKDLHIGVGRLNLYVSNPYLNLFSSQFEEIEDKRRFIKFIYPKKEFDPFSYETLGFGYHFVIKIGEFFFKGVERNNIINNLKFYFNNKYYNNTFYVSEEIDYEKSCLYYSIRFALPDEIKKIENKMRNKEVLNNNTIKIIYNHPFDKNKNFSETVSFHLIKKIDFYAKYY